MLKKIIGFNGSYRKGWNTDLLVQKVLEGAKSHGAETKLIQVSDLKHFKPCISCFSCKKSKESEGKCVINDDFTPILQEIKSADALVFGSPVYHGFMSAGLHCLLERIWYSNTSFSTPNRKYSVFGKQIKTGFVWTMHVSEKISDSNYLPLYKKVKDNMKEIFGSCEDLKAYNTLHHYDYSKYSMGYFNPEDKMKSRKENFPKVLQQAYELGIRLIQ